MDEPTILQTARAYDAVAAEYDDHYDPELDAQVRRENEALVRILQPKILDGGSILDVGCGTGLLLDLFPEIEPGEYMGIDLSWQMIREAKDKFPNYTFAQMAMESLETVGKVTRHVVSTFAVNYSENLLRTFCGMHASMLRGGSLTIVALSNLGSLQPTLGLVAAPVRYGLTPNDLRRTARLACFRSIRVRRLTLRPLFPNYYVLEARA